MSKTTQMLEEAVAEVIANRAAPGEKPTARQRVMIDRAFARVLKIVAPRIRHFIKQYGLAGHWEDAEQVCAIGIHRAIEAYDPAKAMFTTFVNWQIRGELQGLRFRLMDDQRPSARKVEAVTISLQSTERGAEGEEVSLEQMLVDEGSHEATEAAAAEHLARATSKALMDEYVSHLRSVGVAQLKRKARTARVVMPRSSGSDRLPKFVQTRQPQIDPEELAKLEDRIERDRQIVAAYLMNDGADPEDLAAQDRGLTKERIRQITRRATRVMSELAAGHHRFYGEDANETEESANDRASIYPDASQPHNRMVRVSAPALEPEGPVFIETEEQPARRIAGRLRH